MSTCKFVGLVDLSAETSQQLKITLKSVLALSIAQVIYAWIIDRRELHEDFNINKRVPFYLTQLTKDWKADKEVIGAGPSQTVVDKWYHEFGSDYEKVAGK